MEVRKGKIVRELYPCSYKYLLECSEITLEEILLARKKTIKKLKKK